MSDEIQIAGTTYVSSKRAAQISGYAQDYIGQLCRAGAIEAQRVGGLWYIGLDSLYKHKQRADSYIPIAPRKVQVPEAESLISFDGKDYVSAARAAEITGYHRDYVGQLAREGKVLSRQAGKRWYVERVGIIAHKTQKDALLAAVQAESVGISRLSKDTRDREASDHIRYDGGGPYLAYTSDSGDLLPHIVMKDDIQAPFIEVQSSATRRAIEHHIPIRVLRNQTAALKHDLAGPLDTLPSLPQKSVRGSNIALMVPAIVTTVVIVLSLGYVSLGNSAIYTLAKPFPRDTATALTAQASHVIDRIGDILEDWLAPEIVYRRKN